LKEAKSLNNKKWKGIAYYCLGDLSEIDWDLKGALIYYKKAEKKFQEIGDLRYKAKSINKTGEILLKKGELNEAQKNFEEALCTVQNEQTSNLRAKILFNLGEIYDRRKKFKTAFDYYWDALDIFENIGNLQNIGETIIEIGLTLLEIRSRDPHYRLPEERRKNLSVLRAGKGIAHISPNDINAYFRYGLRIGRQTHDKYLQAKSLYYAALHNKWLTEITGRISNFKGTLNEYIASLEIFDQIGYKSYMIRLRKHMGRLYRWNKEWKKAKKVYQEALEIAENLENFNERSQILFEIGELYWEWNRFTLSLSYFKRLLDLLIKQKEQSRSLRTLKI
jgi:tetratricopeptide (TPR) repeat protein